MAAISSPFPILHADADVCITLGGNGTVLHLTQTLKTSPFAGRH